VGVMRGGQGGVVPRVVVQRGRGGRRQHHHGLMIGGKIGVQTKIGNIPGKHNKEWHVPNGVMEMTSCRIERGCVLGMATTMVGKGVAKGLMAVIGCR
jgi:hypothetical protein